MIDNIIYKYIIISIFYNGRNNIISRKKPWLLTYIDKGGEVRMKNIPVFVRIAIFITLFPFLSIAKGPEAPKQKTVQAVRIKGTAKVDGILNEEAWQGQGRLQYKYQLPES